ncbi:MAG TPA: hypothetical protein DIW36_05620 [Ruminococcaceae bacterium]|nr:hypothetical protein [Oscillospiraceae bacterium]
MEEKEMTNKKPRRRTALKVLSLLIFLIAVALLTICGTVRYTCGYEAIYYGKYSAFGIYPPIIGLIASIVLFIVAVFGKKGRKVCGIICAAIIVLTFPYIDGLDYILSKPYKTFSTSTWNIDYHFRHYMIDDLEEKYDLVGMDIEDVKKLLSKDSTMYPMEDANDGNYLCYFIGNEYLWHKTYEIYYNSEGKVTSTKISVS